MKEKLELKDLAPYLPYGLKLLVEYGAKGDTDEYTLGGSDGKGIISIDHVHFGVGIVKPTLRRSSDLTNDELHNLGCILTDDTFQPKYFRIDWAKKWLSDSGVSQCNISWSRKAIEYLYSLHIDLDGLIEKGLAIDINTLKD